MRNIHINVAPITSQSDSSWLDGRIPVSNGAFAMISSYDFFAVERVRKQLEFRVTGAVALCKGSFHNGSYSGVNLLRLFETLGVELEEVDVLDICSQDGGRTRLASWHFQPTLIPDARGRSFSRLQVPRARLQAHRDYKLAGYLLRALADFEYRPWVSDPFKRKELAWEFCDQIRWRYKDDSGNPRSNAEVSAQLAHLASFEELHRADIPLSQIAAFMARSRPDIFSFAVYYTANIQDLLSDQETECLMHVHRELGSSEPRLSVMVDCHCDGHHDLMSSSPLHTQITTPDGCQHIIVTDTPFRTRDYIDSEFKSLSLLEINRTMLFTMKRPLCPADLH